MKKILGVNISHHCSFAYFENDVLKEYYEEDRFNKIKHFEPPNPILEEYEYEVLKKFKNIVFDAVVFVSFVREHVLVDKAYIDNILKQVKTKDIKFYNNYHHIFHAMCGYYFGKFKKALVLVTDGGGDRIFKPCYSLQVMESIFLINNKKIKKFYQAASNIGLSYFNEFKNNVKEIKTTENGVDLKLTNQPIGGHKYLRYTLEAGFKENQEGQLMGIAAYKDKKTNLDKNVLEIANKAQEETLQDRIELIEKALSYSNCKNIILSGGYHLNCANNFKLVKHFPELNFFVDPIPYDGGTAIGVAYYHYEENFKN
jgi:predicted NodU family carbamoyl transferase